MKALQAYVDRKNQWGAIFGSQPLSLKSAADRQKIADSIDSDMSPENLSCDGELPRSQVQARLTALVKAAKELRQLDPSVKMYEAEGWL